MIARIAFSYNQMSRFVSLSEDPASCAILESILGSEMPPKENRDRTFSWPTECLIDVEEDGPRLIALGISFEVKSFKGTRLLEALTPEHGRVTINVQIPHVGLLAIDEVDVLVDCCTDDLRRHLDAGWRILCVCPPNAARRPDYVIGRSKDQH